MIKPDTTLLKEILEGQNLSFKMHLKNNQTAEKT